MREGCDGGGGGERAVILLPSCLCVCIAFVLPLAACTAHVSVDKVSHPTGRQWATKVLYTLHSPLGTRHSHGTLRGWSILPLARHLQICALTHSHTRTVSVLTSCSHRKPYKQYVPLSAPPSDIWSDCTTKQQEKAKKRQSKRKSQRAKAKTNKDRDKRKVQKVKSEQSKVIVIVISAGIGYGVNK